MKEILTSNLPNDADMIKALGPMALPAPIATGDCLFSGINELEQPIAVCIERKKLGDLLSSIHNGRYMHQLQIAHENGADVFVLIAELGEIRSSPEDGMIEYRRWEFNTVKGRNKSRHVWVQAQPATSYSMLDQFLTELDWLAGVIVKRTTDVHETAAVIKALWSNFQTKPSDHMALNKFFKAPPPVAQLVKPSLLRRVAAELPDIGWERSKDIEKHFGTVQEMVNASILEWKLIPGIGDKISRHIVQSLRGGKID